MRAGMVRKTAFIVAAVVLAPPAPAHHSFAAEYDTSKPVHLSGVVVRFDFVNPHGELILEAGTERWRIEAASPQALLRRGISKISIEAGMNVAVDGYQAKSDPHRVYGLDVLLPDGRKLQLNPSRLE